MRFDRERWELTARDILADYTEKELEHIFYTYGEEPKTRFIVDAIIKARKIKPIETTTELAKLIEASSFDQKSKLRVFQALRMEVNNELGVTEEALDDMIHLLDKGWRIEVITFHSLEDRLVKQIFHKYTHDIPDEFTGKTKIPKILEKIHKKPIIPTEEEISQNPRSRSAKLRVVEKISPLNH
jgi:16S rRNA (cytosine1402-N4)-methyltransferase